MKRVLAFLLIVLFVSVPCYGANEVLQKSGTTIVIANSTYSPGANTTLGTRTDDIDIASVGTDTARQGVKFDFGATRARRYSVAITYEMAVDPAAGGSIVLYLSGSGTDTAAVGNAAGCSGADGAYTGYSGSTMDEGLAQLGSPIAVIPVAVQNDTDGVQIITEAGSFAPGERWGCLVLHNDTSQSLHSDSVEAAIRFTPIVDEVQ